MIVTIITFILVFGILVLVHEYGHYYFAKRAGILVREFSIGMGPKIWWTRKNGTTYTVRLLPVGGYVRLAGSDDEDEDELRPGTPLTLQLNQDDQVVTINASSKATLFQGIPMQLVASDLVDGLWVKGYVNGDESELKTYPVNHDAMVVEHNGTVVQIAPRDVQFRSASLPARMMTNFAGPMNNFILSLLVFIILGFTLTGVPTNSNQIGKVNAGSVAAKAGLVAGDRITKVNSTKVANWAELATNLSSKPNQQVKLTYTHKGETKTTTVRPQAVKQGKETVGQIGILEQQEKGIRARLMFGWQQFIQAGTLIFAVLGHMFTHGFSLNDLGGPVAIYAGTSQATALGVNGVLNFLALLSINLGIVNLLPIPALDGGKLLLNIIEAVIRRPIPEKAEGIVTMLGFMILLVLMILVTWNDIQRYFIR
ncbi:MAG: RIP metalloprotease RseP [Limosilactobacillus oris]|uniref:RIP metalloprotease RseP n=1 Tax=Limosilactobacillus oris TaxID=1632 RepID=UPI00174969D3|nr:RIP metalloprotease RseP [Limosilactobacillus oris]MCH3911863.1 RIP metalloprotease RseP [Limosilactobacillus oris]MCH3939115.1 RIP metalloprotease RseP [Limosilactobacillus oris]MCI1980484.1 RIP metalloprotease RseP [Limosilactobacillus oris]MCI2042841.1 RIP metalloprotease RseP [Limosilactobacillus oris]UXC67499.1 RIP metalloprotease RseP [Limosilactobacillus oris]